MFFFFFYVLKIKNNYYQYNKQELWKEACERYQYLSEEERDKKHKKIWERYQNFNEEENKKLRNKNLSEEAKQKLPEYRRNYYLIHKT